MSRGNLARIARLLLRLPEWLRVFRENLLMLNKKTGYQRLCFTDWHELNDFRARYPVIVGSLISAIDCMASNP